MRSSRIQVRVWLPVIVGLAVLWLLGGVMVMMSPC